MKEVNGNGHAKEGRGSAMGGERFEKEGGTDYSRWRMKDDRGTQTWHYLESEEEVEKWPQSVADKWYLGLETARYPSTPSPPQPARIPKLEDVDMLMCVWM